MADTLHSRLILAESYFLNSFQRGPQEAANFSLFWSVLENDLMRAVEAGDVDDDTLDLAQRVFFRMETLASEFMLLAEESEALLSNFQEDVQHLFNGLTLGDIPDAVHTTDASSVLPPYIEEAYAWLINNLHNPYPSKTIKATIARQARCSLNHVDNWFTNVRKRVGWNNLRTNHFLNKRSHIVAAATNFFLFASTEHDDHAADFIEIKNKVETLYSGKVKVSASPMAARPRRCKRTRRQKHRAQPYPSPEPDLSSEPSPSTPKRFRSIDIVEEPFTAKKPRLDLRISEELAMASLPSPTPSLKEIPDTTVTPPCKRKRLSDEDAQRASQRRRLVSSSQILADSTHSPSGGDDDLINCFSFDTNFPCQVVGIPLDDVIPSDVTLQTWVLDPSSTSEDSSSSKTPDSPMTLSPLAVNIFEGYDFLDVLFQDYQTDGVFPSSNQVTSLGGGNVYEDIDWSTLFGAPDGLMLVPNEHRDFGPEDVLAVNAFV